MRFRLGLSDILVLCIRMIHQKVGRDIPSGVENLIHDEVVVRHPPEIRHRLHPLAGMIALWH